MQLPTKITFKNLEKSKYLALMPNLKEEKTQKFTTTIFTILALIFFGIFAINPTLSTIASLQKQVQDDQFVEQKLQDKINNLSLLQQQYSQIKPDLPIIYSAIPQKSDIPLLMGQIQSLAASSNLTLINLQTFPVDVSNDLIANKSYSSFVFGTALQGSYQDMKNFISQFVSMQRILTIESISISKITNGTSSVLQLNIKADAYFKQ